MGACGSGFTWTCASNSYYGGYCNRVGTGCPTGYGTEDITVDGGCCKACATGHSADLYGKCTSGFAGNGMFSCCKACGSGVSYAPYENCPSGYVWASGESWLGGCCKAAAAAVTDV